MHYGKSEIVLYVLVRVKSCWPKDFYSEIFKCQPLILSEEKKNSETQLTCKKLSDEI